MALSACACGAEPETTTDATAAVDNTVTCTEYTMTHVRTSDGQRFDYVEYRAELDVEPATSFPRVRVVGCNPIIFPPATPACPAGFTCTGMTPSRPTCFLSEGGAFSQAGRLSIPCGVRTAERTSNGVTVAETANYYRSLIIRVE
jgi:hypothetical protein